MPGFVMKSKKITAALLTLALLACLQAGRAYAAAKDYKDAEHGFSFSYPETWQYRHLANYLEVTSPYAGDFRAVVVVQVSPPLEAMMTSEALASFHKMLMEDVNVSSFRKTELNGVPCAVFDTIDEKQFRHRLYMANHGKKGYTLVFTAISGDYGNYEDSFKMILDSFKF